MLATATSGPSRGLMGINLFCAVCAVGSGLLSKIRLDNRRGKRKQENRAAWEQPHPTGAPLHAILNSPARRQSSRGKSIFQPITPFESTLQRLQGRKQPEGWLQ